MIKTYKIKLNPNNKQKTKMFQFCGAKRFAYNWAIAKEKENYFPTKYYNKFAKTNGAYLFRYKKD